MKNKIGMLFLLFFVISFRFSFAQETTLTNAVPDNIEMTHATIEIAGMACQEGCANKIASNLTEAKGVFSAKISFDHKLGNVIFDPKIISAEEVKHIIVNTKVKDYVYTIKSIHFNKE
ncbi:heavy-metal-associated domain-containing protein [Maribacter sp. LLG6340-A2]|uniref:heavy-metal-associated domain-containing protein n=1 Tax=Maribacter sp. LLG6340-A2 TaxID=3160834 RepID=UPI003864BFBB